MFSGISTVKGEPIRASKQKAKHKCLKDNLFNKKKLLFGTGKEINLSDEFVAAVEEISKFTRENDTIYPYSVINPKIQEFDTIRTAIGLVSNALPISKAYKMTQSLISYLADAFSGSALVVPASNLYNLRGPVNLSKVTYQLYENKQGQNGLYYYKKSDDKITYDEIIIKI